MSMYFKIILVLILSAVITGCAGGKKTIPVEEIQALDADTAGAFVFVESPILNIDSDLMADRFGVKRRGVQTVILDSITALNTVYEILLDSILGQDAAHFDLATEEPSLYRQYERLLYDKVMRLMYQDVIVDSVVVNDSAIRAQYEADRETFLVPELYRARHIVMAGKGFRDSDDSAQYASMTDEELDSLAQSRVVELRQRLLDGASFDTLAMLYSQDENTAEHGGDLGYFQLSQMVSPFDSTVENTPMGKISGIIKTEYGWHVLTVDDHTPEHIAPLDSVYVQLENKLKEEGVVMRSKAFIDSLRESATIVFDTTALQLADSLHQKEDAMAYVNPADKEFGNDTLYFREYNENVYAFKKHKKIEGDLTFDDKIELLSGIAVRLLLTQTARKLGFFNDPSVKEWVEMTIKKYSVSTLRKRVRNDDYEPTEDELRTYYDSHLDDYQVERPLTVQHIVFADSNLAEHVRDLLMSGTDFMEMVDMYYPGDPEIKRAAADLGEIGPDDMPSEFYAAANATQVNSISRPVKTVYGYHLIKVLKKVHSINFDRSKVEIKSILKKRRLEEKIKKLVDSRLEKPPVIHWELLDKLYFQERVAPDLSQMRNAP